jgi:2,4-dienoyl-CoA reductase-like NADH-dependent reductase (Old Yellow Enzyme family)
MGANNQKSNPTLLDPIKLGPYVLKNRIVMAPMTRGRSDPFTNLPNDLN